MSSRVEYNGSRFAGQEPATFEELLVVLEEHKVDRYSVNRAGLGGVRVHGNFEDVSHAFSVFADGEDARRLMEALSVSVRNGPRRWEDGCRCRASHFGRFAS